MCLDIETTGGDPSPSSLTVVGIHRNGRSLQLIADRGLSEHTVNDALAGAPMLITFFGSVFDIPFLTRVFPQLSVPPLHFDLCFAARRIGLRGGLKSVERALGLTRTMDIMGLGGWDAVVLWQQYRRGNPRALERLLRYNSADTEHLAPLAHHLYGMLARQLGPSIWPHHALPQA